MKGRTGSTTFQGSDVSDAVQRNEKRGGVVQQIRDNVTATHVEDILESSSVGKYGFATYIRKVQSF